MALRQYHKLQLVRGLFALPSCSPSTSSASPLFLENPSITTSGNNAVLDHPAAAWRPSAFRSYHNPVGGLDLAWSRRGLFAELPVVSAMLPNQELLAKQHVIWSPHGLTSIPKAIFAAAAASSPPAPAVQEPTNPTQQTPMQAIGIKTWRRLKMKKHKIRKRRKEARMQVKKN